MAETYLGQTVAIGDEVVYLKNLRTGSSTIRKCNNAIWLTKQMEDKSNG